MSLVPSHHASEAPAPAIARLVPPPRNALDVVTSPTVARTFSKHHTQLPALALSAINLIEADAPLLRVLVRACDVLRGDAVPFVHEREREGAAERARRVAPAPLSAIRSVVAEEDQPARTEAGHGDVEMADASLVDVKPDISEAALAREPSPLPHVEVTTTVLDPAQPTADLHDALGFARPVGAEVSRSTSPAASVSALQMPPPARQGSQSPGPMEMPVNGPETGVAAMEDDGLASRPSTPGAEQIQESLPDSLRRVVQPDDWIRSLFVSDADIILPAAQHLGPLPGSLGYVQPNTIPAPSQAGALQTLTPSEQLAALHQATNEIQRFLTDTIEYRERLGELRDGVLGIERRRRGVWAILRLFAQDALEYEEADALRDAHAQAMPAHR